MAAHFSQPRHLPRVMVLESAPEDNTMRHVMAAQWIARFRSTAVTVLNGDDGLEVLDFVT